MFYLYRTISDFYSNRYATEINKRGCSPLALKLNEKRSYWYSKMFNCKGEVFMGWGKV